jgi:aminoglycoside 3-N-acetyltransferase
MVHSGIKAFAGFSQGAAAIIRVFEDAVGSGGTLLMPAFSMQGSALEFVRGGKTFDVRRTPSQTGMLTEVFRRSPGVLRSIHPTHSVAVWSKEAAWWIQDHHLAGTPCGRATPFFRLLERGGKIVLAGVDVSALTFYHCVEELLEDRMPASPFTAQRYIVKCRYDGEAIETAPFRLYDPDMSKRRTLRPLELELRKRGRWTESRAGSVRIVALNATDVLRTVAEMAERGTFCYRAA